MIRIDMEMPKCCGDCDLENNGCFCVVTGDNTFSYRNKWRMDSCPLHPLDDEIRVGDEVCFGDGETFKAVMLDKSVVNGSWCVLTENGCVSVFDEKKLHRTGRHFDEVETLLKKMRGEEDA